MTNEAVVIELYGELEAGEQRRFVCASGVKISKGTILQLTDPRTASTSNGSTQAFAGIASMDKAADDLSTSISAWEKGVFDLICSGGIVAGDDLITGGTGNYVAKATTASSGFIVGVALETGDDEEVINVRVNN